MSFDTFINIASRFFAVCVIEMRLFIVGFIIKSVIKLGLNKMDWLSAKVSIIRTKFGTRHEKVYVNELLTKCTTAHTIGFMCSVSPFPNWDWDQCVCVCACVSIWHTRIDIFQMIKAIKRAQISWMNSLEKSNLRFDAFFTSPVRNWRASDDRLFHQILLNKEHAASKYDYMSWFHLIVALMSLLLNAIISVKNRIQKKNKKQKLDVPSHRLLLCLMW